MNSPYIPPHHFLVSANYRGGGTRLHWEGFNRTHDIQSGVRNHTQILDFSAVYQVTKQSQIGVDVPFVFNARRGLYGNSLVPKDTLHFRHTLWQDANGLGDITIIGRRWLFNTEKVTSGNISLGFGTILPTGSWKASWGYPEGVRAPVDVSIQPGQGGTGMIAEVQAFKTIKHKVTVYGIGSYTAQPRNTNGTLITSWQRSAVTNMSTQIGYINNTGIGRQVTNSVPDFYVGEVGLVVPVPKVRGLFLTAASRIEGVTVRDLIGGSAGFRRPGFELYAVPGFGYARGKNTLTVQVPLRAMINVMDNPHTPRKEDATMPNALVIVRYLRMI